LYTALSKLLQLLNKEYLMRILSKELKEHIGKQVLVQGWLHKKRLLGGLTFINLRDRGGLVQVVLKDKNEVEKLRGLQIGTVLEVTATVKEEPRAPGGVELHDAKLNRYGAGYRRATNRNRQTPKP
jgi:aspartyl/asparaginyl-tRNA synthetase